MKLIQWLLSLFKRLSIDRRIPIKPKRTLAWGNKVSAAFRNRIFEIAEILGVYPDYVMACIAFESNETFSPSIKNMAGSGATGLIQFMPKTAIGLGTTVEALARMTAVQQLDWVLAYFKPYRSRLNTLSDLYMSILWPRAIGQSEHYILWSKGTSPNTYRQNSGLDANGDHDITKSEATAKVQAALQRGMLDKHLWVEP